MDMEKGKKALEWGILGLIVAGSLVWLWGNRTERGEKPGNWTTSDKLVEYTKAVYAPKSMDEFNSAKAEAVELGIMSESLANQFFRAYGTELTEADKARTCIARATHSEKEYQSDGAEKYMVNASLYNTPTSAPIRVTIIFKVNEETGVIDRYEIIVDA